MSKAVIVLLAVALPTLALAAPKERGAAFAPIARCRELAEDAARLACYDREVAAFDRQVKDKQVAVIDRGEVTAAKRSLFGIALPDIKLFGGKDEEIKQVDATVTSAQFDDSGRLVFTVGENGSWIQTDDYPIGLVKPGRKVTLKRGMLGSFFADFGKGPSIRAKRIR